MAILSTIEKKTFKGVVIVIALYSFAVCGGLSMIVPFATLIGDSLRSDADVRSQGDRGILPSYLFGEEWLWRKYLLAKYGSINAVNKIKNRGMTSYVYSRDIPSPPSEPPGEGKIRLAKDYIYFMKDYAQKHPSQFYVAFSGTSPLNLSCWLTAKKFMSFLKNRYETIEELNRVYCESNTAWTNVAHMQEPLELREWYPDYKSRKVTDWYDFKKELPIKYLLPVRLDERFMAFLARKGYLKETGKITENFRLGDNMDSRNHKYKELKLKFIRTRVPLRLITIKKEAFIKWLKEKYSTVAAFNMASKENVKKWSDVCIPADFGTGSTLFDKILSDFIIQMSYDDFKLCLPETAFRAFLRKKYSGIKQLNANYGSSFRRWEEINIPLESLDRMEFTTEKGYFRPEFAKRNFIIISDYLLINGRAFFNTFVLVVLTILFALTVNPLCAYALSRFNMKFTHQILLFCLTTMAFPPEVTMIPSFLMLKEFNLLNSFPALFLPGMANGFSIFLLKGFFDSLPDELFDAARIDGCSEIMMFWRIAFPLTTPILAVISLNAFAVAYGGFLWAYIVCPDSRYWTVMVHLHALTKMGVGVGVQSAGFILATIPSLLVFLFAQKVILKGIVVPQMK